MWTFVDPFDYRFSSECERPFDYQFRFVFEHLSIFLVFDSGLYVNLCQSFWVSIKVCIWTCINPSDYQFRFVSEDLSIFSVINSGLRVNVCRSFQLLIQICKWTFVDLFNYQLRFACNSLSIFFIINLVDVDVDVNICRSFLVIDSDSKGSMNEVRVSPKRTKW